MKKKSKADKEYEKKFNRIAKQMNAGKPVQPQPKPKGPTAQQKVSKAQRSGLKVEVVQKNTTNKKSYVSNVGKLLDEDLEIKTIPKEIATQVQQARNDAKLTQEDLAKKISEKVSDIKDLESANGVYKPKIVEKIEKALNVKFERSWKKQESNQINKYIFKFIGTKLINNISLKFDF